MTKSDLFKKKLDQKTEDKRISTDIDPTDHSGEERFDELECRHRIEKLKASLWEAALITDKGDFIWEMNIKESDFDRIFAEVLK